MILDRRSVLGAAALLAPASAHAQAPPLDLTGRFVQGGFALGRTEPRARILLDGEAITQASADGYFVVGFDRDAAAQARLAVVGASGRSDRRLAVDPGDFDVQRINGLPPSQVSPTAPKLLARIRAEGARKSAGFASRVDRDDFRSGFVMPLKAYRVSGRFGGQRILNGEPKRPHYGTDLAAPVGAAVTAPAGGVVSFAESGLHFEGGLILIDHGQGLVSAYLHLSQIEVAKGQSVIRGQRIGAVGKEGRATGPHLCWRVTWRRRHLDPMLLVQAKAPGIV